MTKFVIVPFCQYSSLREFYLLISALGHILRYVRMCAIEADYVAVFPSNDFLWMRPNLNVV